MAKNAATKTAKSGQTKRLIVTTFLKLIEEKKWDRITVIEICRNAGVTRGTFYQYFSDIYDLMEQLETSLLEDLESRYRNCGHDDRKAYPIASFPVKYDYTPPAIFLAWFEFCRDHRDAMVALLNRINGDTYFVKRLKAMISERIEEMMDREGMARDDLRSHFLKIFLELHLLSALSWLESEDEEDYLSVEDIVNLLNTMRVGSMYLSYKRSTDPEFAQRMTIDRV